MKALPPARLLTAFLVLLSGAPAAAADTPPASVTTFVHVTIVPMDREVLLEDQTVVVMDGRIRKIGPAAKIEVPEKSIVIDGHGKYLMPGLADMHTHTWDENDFKLLLANGVTTIRKMFGDPMQLEWRLVAPDVAKLVEFLRRAFEAEGELRTDRPCQMRIGDSLVMVSGVGPRELMPAFLYLYIDDIDAVYKRALEAGAASLEAPTDTPYGDRRGMVRDPGGNIWQIATHKGERTTPK